MVSVTSTHSFFFNALDREYNFAFRENLPIAARWASIDIIMKKNYVRNFFTARKIDVRKVFRAKKNLCDVSREILETEMYVTSLGAGQNRFQ